MFDEPSTGLHPVDIAALVGVFDRLLDGGATVVVIDHDLDLLAAADHLIDMGPVGGPAGGRVVASGHPAGGGRQRRQRHRPVPGATPEPLVQPRRLLDVRALLRRHGRSAPGGRMLLSSIL